MLPQLKQFSIRRVAAYARVSTASEIQLHSLQNQIEYYTTKITGNPNWQMVGVFIDEGISATSTHGRSGMCNLLQLAENHQVDLILTKSISRFSRNITDLLKITRQLRALDVEVYFEKENISTVTADGELMLSLMGTFAQMESENISSNIKWRIEKDRMAGISTQHPRVLGYTWVDGRPAVNVSEAKIVRQIYDLYEGGLSGQAIATQLKSASHHFSSSSIYYILRNPIYCGDLLLGRHYTTSPICGRTVKNRGERPMYLVEDDHEAIIEKPRWRRVQDLIKERISYGKCKNYSSCFTGGNLEKGCQCSSLRKGQH